MRMKTVRESVVVLLILCLVAGLSLNSWAGEAASTSKEKKEAAVKVEKEEADLIIGSVSGTTVAIDLVNNVPVRGLQFTVKGAEGLYWPLLQVMQLHREEAQEQKLDVKKNRALSYGYRK